MANGSPFAVNFLYLAFLLVPGYASLRGYLGATVQLDTVSRFDKLLLSAVGGTLTLAVSLISYRSGFVESVWRLLPDVVKDTASLGSDPLPVSVASSTSVSATVASVVGLSSLGYLLGYCCGTVVHVWNGRERSQQDLEQPWEAAIRQSALGDEVVVVTRDGERIRGELYRIGSASEEYDLILAKARREAEDGVVPLGMTYHHYRDVARVQFPQMRPKSAGVEANTLVRGWMWAWSGIVRVGRCVRRAVNKGRAVCRDSGENEDGQ